MTGKVENSNERFQVIDGGRRSGFAVRPCLQLPAPVDMRPAELAAEMAELYAMMLLRDTPFAAMSDPHHAIWIDGATRFTLHEMLCEMRSLSWFDRERRPQTLDETCDARRQMRLNHEGQLTLASMFRGMLAPTGSEPQGLSLFHCIDHSAPEGQGAPAAVPDAEAPMSSWIDWLAAEAGAAPKAAKKGAGSLASPATPRDLAFRMQAGHPGRVYYNAALALLSRGTAFDSGLTRRGGDAPISAQRLLALMAETTERAFEAVLRRQARPDRSSAPAVTAARLGFYLGGDELPAEPLSELQAAAEDLLIYAPNLLHWVQRANAARARKGRRFRAYELTEVGLHGVPRQASDAALQVVVAGALSTLFKALFDTRPAPRLRMATDPAPSFELGAEVDRLAADIALAAAVCGGQMQAENHQNLRIGEALALQVLHGWLAQLPQGASMEFSDFDGGALRIESHLNRTGSPEIALRRNGRPVRFPLMAERRDAHLAVI